MPRKSPTEGSPPSSRSKLVATAAIALATAQGCLGLAGTGPNDIAPTPDSGTPPSSDGGVEPVPDASDKDSFHEDAPAPVDSTAPDNT